MLTGKKTFEGKSQASFIAAILDRDPPPISSVQPMTPAQLDHLGGLMAADPRPFRNTGVVIGIAIDPAGNRLELIQRP